MILRRSVTILAELPLPANPNRPGPTGAAKPRHPNSEYVAEGSEIRGHLHTPRAPCAMNGRSTPMKPKWWLRKRRVKTYLGLSRIGTSAPCRISALCLLGLLKRRLVDCVTKRVTFLNNLSTWEHPSSRPVAGVSQIRVCVAPMRGLGEARLPFPPVARGMRAELEFVLLPASTA